MGFAQKCSEVKEEQSLLEIAKGFTVKGEQVLMDRPDWPFSSSLKKVSAPFCCLRVGGGTSSVYMI